jgi:hypothetical protein
VSLLIELSNVRTNIFTLFYVRGWWSWVDEAIYKKSGVDRDDEMRDVGNVNLPHRVSFNVSGFPPKNQKGAI